VIKVCAALVALAAAVRCDLKVQRRAIYDSRSVLNDAHKLIHAVSKGLENRPPKPYKINDRISPIRPFQKVWGFC
jgi:hypothetical protein